MCSYSFVLSFDAATNSYIHKHNISNLSTYSVIQYQLMHIMHVFVTFKWHAFIFHVFLSWMYAFLFALFVLSEGKYTCYSIMIYFLCYNVDKGSCVLKILYYLLMQLPPLMLTGITLVIFLLMSLIQYKPLHLL